MNKFKIQNATIGSDFELFLQDKETKEVVSAEPYIKGSKYEPYQFDPDNPFFAVSLDNVLAEACIPPVTTKQDWLAYIRKSIDYISKSIPPNLCTAALPSAILDKKYLRTRNARTFGCEPDWNCWLKAENPSPKASNPCLRSGGGHIHIGYDEPSLASTEWLIKAMDLFIGVPSVLQEPDNERKLLYGKAGAFRIKPYGGEYRTVSNYYLQSDDLIAWVFDNTQLAIDFVNQDRLDEIDSVGSQIQEAINSANKVLAQNLIHQFNIPMV